MVGRPPLAGNRNDCKAGEESGAKASVGKTLTIADGGYPGTGRVSPHRRLRGQSELPAWKEEHNKSHNKQVRARVEHALPVGGWFWSLRPGGGGVGPVFVGVRR
ncbi:hypothetical protein GA0115236_139845 [Streptomyces sp. IgraMP-1]|nr:hypothetical protein GA0115236_139845 [Streptomyces sp. IgraMP-1]